MFSEFQAIPPPPIGDGPCERRYVDEAGVAWCVQELAVRHGAPALYFESAAAFRRVTHYPPDWRELAIVELELLSHQT